MVLVEPQLGENIGMAARAMANFGLAEIRLVRPRDQWLNQKTRAAAAGAEFILERRPALPLAARGNRGPELRMATTARERGQGKAVVGPDEAAAIQGGGAEGQRRHDVRARADGAGKR